MTQDELLARCIVARLLGQKLGEVFPSDKALKEYLKKHPHADRSKHRVEEDRPKAKEEPSAKPRSGLFSPSEVKHLPEAAKQPTKDPDKLFSEARKAHEHQLKWLNQGEGLDKAIEASVIRGDKGEEVNFDKKGPVILIGPMKKQERAKEKVEADFGGDWSRLGDVVRASVAVDSYDQLTDVLNKLQKTGLKLARKPKDRFAKPTEAGYRDILLNVKYPNGHVGELQLHLKPILKAKNAGHEFYEKVRTIEGRAKKEGRETMTDEETQIVNEANRKMRDLYDQAWEQATKSKTASLPMKITMRFIALSGGTKYYEYEDLPAYWEPKKFPKLVSPKGEKAVYELQKFFTQANPISSKEFEDLKDSD